MNYKFYYFVFLIFAISFEGRSLQVFCKSYYSSASVKKINQREFLRLTSRQMPFDLLNKKYNALILANPSLNQFAHKLPNPFISDNTVNYLALVKSIVEDLQGMPQSLDRFSTLTKETLDSRNRVVLDLLSTQAKENEGVDLSVVQNLLAMAKNHSVAGIPALLGYDLNPANNKRVHGFCFGRADLLYWEALKLGVPKSALAKLFQVGSIEGDKTFGRPWSNHIVFTIKVKKMGWIAIDPLYGELMSPMDWYEKNQSVALNGKSMLFVGRPERMYTQGGESHFPGLADLNFPSGRAQLKAPDKDGLLTSFESNFIFKDVFWQRYYNDLITSVLENNHGPYAGYFCQVTGLCRTH